MPIHWSGTSGAWPNALHENAGEWSLGACS